MNSLESELTLSERRTLHKLKTPFDVQNFLDDMPYPSGTSYHCPLQVIRRQKAHCFDGALLAAALLRMQGHPPLIVYMIADNDDDHLIAPFKKQGHWGAVAKSNCVGLRFREPIHRTLRELMMSYFEQFFNLHRKKSLRSYTRPLNLQSFDEQQWMIRNAGVENISDQLDRQHVFRLLTPRMVRDLSPVDLKSYRAGFLGSNRRGLFRPVHEE
jgi:hypothetical protein